MKDNKAIEKDNSENNKRKSGLQQLNLIGINPFRAVGVLFLVAILVLLAISCIVWFT